MIPNTPVKNFVIRTVIEWSGFFFFFHFVSNWLIANNTQDILNLTGSLHKINFYETSLNYLN